MPPAQLCQRCNQPIQLDPSLSEITPAQYSLIVSSLPPASASTSSSPSTSLDLKHKLSDLPPYTREAAKIWRDANDPPLSGDSSIQTGLRSVAESFILLSDSALQPTSSKLPGKSLPPHDLDLSTQLHQILSSNTPVSHPLCTECTALLTAEFQRMAEELSKERDAYIRFEQAIRKNKELLETAESSRKTVKTRHVGGLAKYDVEGTEEEWDALIKKKEELELEEERLKLLLESTEKELEVALEEERLVELEAKMVEQEENDFLSSHSALSIHLAQLASTLNTANTSLLLSRSLLAHLESTNVYNDAFHIGHVPLLPLASSSITVGTINGLRLGGRPVVEWDEINAAWGLAALCLHRIAEKVGCVFETYKIVPLGSYSRVEELPPSKSTYELYASSDMTPARLLQNRRFNHAMVAFLECLRQLLEFGKKHGKQWAQANIDICKDKISNHSIRLPGISSMPLGLPSMAIMGLAGNGSNHPNPNGSNGKSQSGSSTGDSTAEEGWTRACRTVLGVLKRVLIMESETDRGSISEQS
ncbi:beclin 1 [Cryptococcus deuterogattii 99/473]|uniref:Beclin 1 n=2 Tax=Cryptococcus deuterogattii TaxID=1859096 RepID=A0A0D0V840_9TREE|nr:beclin 1 [Cryptococcus deuterogattii R265]KIR25011.1 beclin 1 [Cryptococcus deuterogattii LA55]KIR37116.1 beclin 1 [Cryptococcus deuterogattii MMRL2647]KIR43586.1 beclin 1 [Cryptococcus deuterogattii Ram5]KIR74920.1 beclin 1 [Cryptococcus deuterogattii CA1014]KIR92589.1 beclin 1 [Cryptococcus deuterogattii CBS 10090]KIR97910.1 beclin 1 [Cryptococcus deuterogattii 2001/935-1]KIY54806.1 beclin 1 [Cryptococcus deuterogattii 99/473]